jgi:hypothetical protein
MMTKLLVISPLVGTPGEEYIVKPGTNVQALIDGGFICMVASDVDVTTLGTVSTKPPRKARKVKAITEE